MRSNKADPNEAALIPKKYSLAFLTLRPFTLLKAQTVKTTADTINNIPRIAKYTLNGM
jgi:hypothetical protein